MSGKQWSPEPNSQPLPPMNTPLHPPCLTYPSKEERKTKGHIFNPPPSFNWVPITVGPKKGCSGYGNPGFISWHSLSL